MGEKMEEVSKEEPKEMVMESPPRLFRRKKWSKFDRNAAFYFLILHLLCIFAPFCFSWTCLLLALGLSYLICIGVTVSYHRNLAHRSFKLPKWLEYSLAYIGAHAIQGDPIDWVSTHRCHHRFVDTERDPHSPIYGFWFSQIMWLFDSFNLTRKVCPNYFNNYQKVERNIFMFYMKHGYPTNAIDLEKQWFYRFLHKTYWLHPIALSLLLYAIGGLPFIIWGMCVRFVFTTHVTSLVNSVCHIWGNKPWNTGDLSKNNWMVALLTFGEGWHNNHHAFEYSARLGHEWWQIDVGWYIIRFLQVIGLATDVKLPSKNKKFSILTKSKFTTVKPI